MSHRNAPNEGTKMKAKGYPTHKGSSGMGFHMAGCSAVKRGKLWVADHGGYYHRTAKAAVWRGPRPAPHGVMARCEMELEIFLTVY